MSASAGGRRERLIFEIAAWERQRNASAARIKWMFTTEKARARLGRAYPQPYTVPKTQTNESYSLCAGTTLIKSREKKD